MFENVKATLKGVSPLLMHNGQLADPLNPYTKRMKQLTSLKKKTDDIHLQVRKAEWEGSLYLNENKEVGIPADLVLAAVINGAKKQKNGMQAKSAIMPAKEFFILDHDGPADLEKLYEDNRFKDIRGVRVGNARVCRTRPKFNNWSLNISLDYDPEILNRNEVVQALEKAGELVGIGDFRPRFGRFVVEVRK